MKEGNKNIFLMALFIALGVMLPFLAGMAGMESHLLTMQAVVILAGFLLPLNMAVACAGIPPVLCWLLLGNPEFFPALPIVVCQLIAIVSFINMMRFSLDMPPVKALLVSIVLGWLVHFSAASILSWITDGFNAVSYSLGIIVNGWPGLALQVIFIPIIVDRLEKRRSANENN